MSDTLNNETEPEKKARQMRTIRKIWMFLIPLFVIVVLFNLYNWSNGEGNIRSIYPPLGMIFVGLATTVGEGKQILRYAFLALGMIFVVTGLVLTILY